ncbi:hypothetical protein BGZ65_000534 [Modicella reniformis]|uniref:Uncharacterized protein n=1 Tax=Modicella reniformis TaxID=1440133 RepID=A0A9P6IP86_9FUNG|nr:hypothetical protein BGZ65_000534 [Modicella reniformis]
MQLLRHSILLLKEAPGRDSEDLGQSSAGTHQQQQEQERPTQESDPYESALRALANDHVETTVDYLAPMATVFPESTVLSEAIAAGYPNTPFCRRGGHQERRCLDGSLWAFAVTSQNAVHAIEEALQQQLDPGATLASVKRVGFKTINCASPLAAEPTFGSGPTLSLDNGAQLVDFLISLEWPSEPLATATTTEAEVAAATKVMASTGENVPSPINSAPELWFLTGETRMKTLPETLTAHQKPFREVIVYKTEPRPLFEREFAQWLADKTIGTRWNEQGVIIEIEGSSSSSSSPSTTTTTTTTAAAAAALDKDRGMSVLWLVGFSPQGVDIAVPTLKTYFEECARQHHQTPVTAIEEYAYELRWAAIGPTTAKRIEEYLATTLQILQANLDPNHLVQQPNSIVRWSVKFNPTVAVAKAPKPEAVAQAIFQS